MMLSLWTLGWLAASLSNRVSRAFSTSTVVGGGSVSAGSRTSIWTRTAQASFSVPYSSSTSSLSSTTTPDESVAVGNTDAITADNPLHVLVAGAGVGGLALANSLVKLPHVQVTVLEQTAQFQRFGGPIQLASNAMQLLREMDADLYKQITRKFTVTGDKMNGIKDGIRTEWYAKFDLQSPAKARNMPYTGVIDRPDLQQLYLDHLPPGTVRNGDGVDFYTQSRGGGGVDANIETPSSSSLDDDAVTVTLQSGDTVTGDVLIGADGIWSSVRACMRDEPRKGDGCGASYSGYTLLASEIDYTSPDHGDVGYKVYIGPNQYFVITDVGNGRYQWYAFLARPADTKLQDMNQYLQREFKDWSPEIHAILQETPESEIQQRDLYDRPPSVFKPWTDGRVALLGDGIHAMMPNLGQGGCQAIEDAHVIGQELGAVKRRSDVAEALKRYQRRRLVRSAAVQGLSRFASDIIIQGFDTPAKIVRDKATGEIRFENFNYAGIVTKLLQPVLPLFFAVQFNFLYDGYQNKNSIDLKAAVAFAVLGGVILAVLSFELAEAGLGVRLGAGALFGAEGILDFDAISTAVRELLPF